MITTGLATAAGVSGLGAAAVLAQRYGLIPPDHGGIFGAGESLSECCRHLDVSAAYVTIHRTEDATVVGRDETVALGEDRRSSQAGYACRRCQAVVIIFRRESGLLM